MSAGHTPGPWHVIDKWNVSGPQYEVANGSIMVRDDDESAANAHLIAAAPDLLAALEYCAREDGTHPANKTAVAKAAIAKARGMK